MTNIRARARKPHVYKVLRGWEVSYVWRGKSEVIVFRPWESALRWAVEMYRQAAALMKADHNDGD